MKPILSLDLSIALLLTGVVCGAGASERRRQIIIHNDFGKVLAPTVGEIR